MSSTLNGHSVQARCLDCGQVHTLLDHPVLDPASCPCGGRLDRVGENSEAATLEAISWARQAISHLLWGDPPLATFNAERLELALPVLEQMHATLRPAPPDPGEPAPPTNAETFSRAFGLDEPVDAPGRRNVTRHWSELATVGLDALIAFRSAVHRWHAAGRVPDRELFAEIRRLELAGLGGWFDHLVCLALAAESIEEVQNGHPE